MVTQVSSDWALERGTLITALFMSAKPLLTSKLLKEQTALVFPKRDFKTSGAKHTEVAVCILGLQGAVPFLPSHTNSVVTGRFGQISL